MLNQNLRLFYLIKPAIPRRLQLALRRLQISLRLARHCAVWPIDERTAAPPPDWTGWPEGKRFALVLTHDVESPRGYDRVLKLAELEEKLGFRSSFNFVAEDYPVAPALLQQLERRGFEVGVHGLTHDGSLYHSRKEFLEQAARINQVLKDWKAAGFRSPCMYHNLEWLHDLDIEYDASTFDTDPFEPQPDALGTIFPLFVPNPGNGGGYVELPYTLPQDLHLFVLMQETSIDIWKKKLHWLAENGGLAMSATHPDYMAFGSSRAACDEYPAERYAAFLDHIAHTYQGAFWHPLPRELARFWKLRSVAEPSARQSAGAWSGCSEGLPQNLPFNDLLSCSSSQGSSNHCRSLGREPQTRLPCNLSPARKIANHQEGKQMGTNSDAIVWVDLDNTPHVPFFKPIVEELQKRGYELILTARDCFQVCGLADLMALSYRRVGKHYGKNKLMKVAGTVLRSIELSPTILGARPSLAISHGSRSQMLLAKTLGIPTVLIMDYEHAQSLVGIRPTWIMMPEVIAAAGNISDPQQVITYPGNQGRCLCAGFRTGPLDLERARYRRERDSRHRAPAGH